MKRVLLVGPKRKLSDAVETLHGLRLLHILDFVEPDEEFSLGNPLSPASQASADLVKLRSISSMLKIDPRKTANEKNRETTTVRVTELEAEIVQTEAERKALESSLADLRRQALELEGFVALGLRSEDYRGYDSLQVFVGKTERDPSTLEGLRGAEIFRSGNYVALFVPRARSDEVGKLLGEAGFVALPLPEGDWDPRDRKAALETEISTQESRLEQFSLRLTKQREKYGGLVVSLDEKLSVDVEKAEAPLRFAVSEHSFVVDGWVPEDALVGVQKAFAGNPEILVQELDAEGRSPPVELKNPRAASPFEFLIHMYSTPTYREIDPTLMLALFFPLFFGIMIGDAGYGLLMLLIGIAIYKLVKSSPDFRDLGYVMAIGGVVALLFGLFVFGEAFGIPFHHEEHVPDVLQPTTWEAILGVEIPLTPILSKLGGVFDLLFVSIVAAMVHLGLAFLIGFANEIGHNKKHAMAKVSWLVILTSLFVLLALAGAKTHVGEFVVGRFLFWVPLKGALVAGVPAVVELGALQISVVALVGVGVGAGLLAAYEGAMGTLEILGLFANMLSYLRLAGFAIGKGAWAAAFNLMFIPLLVSGSPVFIIMGAVFMFLGHALILILGGLASGIQALRLNYVEFFMKFYHGNGIRFSPFGAPRST